MTSELVVLGLFIAVIVGTVAGFALAEWTWRRGFDD